MNITNNFLNFKNIQNNPNNGQLYGKTAPLKCDSVSFTGTINNSKEIKDTNDKAFVNILSENLKLNEKDKEKLNNTVYDFLKENNIQTLDEIGGDDNFDQQYELHEKISSALSLSEDLNNYLEAEIINRTDNKEDYIPLGLNGYKQKQIFEKALSGAVNIFYGLDKMHELDEDNKLFVFVKKMLRQTPEESYHFRKEINTFLKEENIKSISELFHISDSDEDDEIDFKIINKQAALMDILVDKFNLDETEENALNIEFLNRGDEREENYEPQIPLHIKDSSLLNYVIKQEDCDYDEGFDKFSNHLFSVMNDEAEIHNYKNIFEIFNNKDNLSDSETLKFINNDKTLSHEQKMDLIIALSKIAKNPEEYSINVPKRIGRDNFYAMIQTDMISNEIIKTFNLANPYDNDSHNVLRKDINHFLIKMYPSHIKGGENCNINQISYEISEKYNLNSGAEKEIEKIIAKIKDSGTRAADEWLHNKLLNVDEE